MLDGRTTINCSPHTVAMSFKEVRALGWLLVIGQKREATGPCKRVCERVSVCVCVFPCKRACVCVCPCKRACVCVCACVSVYACVCVHSCAPQRTFNLIGVVRIQYVCYDNIKIIHPADLYSPPYGIELRTEDCCAIRAQKSPDCIGISL